MIYDFRKGESALYFSSLLNIDYNLDDEEYELSINDLEIDEIGFVQKSRKNGLTRLGIFLPTYYDIKYGTSPALHVYKCITTESRNDRMRATNMANNTYFSNDDNKNKTVNLKICKECLRNLRSNYRIKLGEKNFNNFILTLEENPRTKQTITDRNGYILNWKQVSFCFRDSKNFTCEKCNFKANNNIERKFLHTHHIDGVKKNNSRYNFQCLCIKCHSEVDDHHRNKFQLEGLVELRAFIEYLESKKIKLQ